MCFWKPRSHYYTYEAIPYLIWREPKYETFLLSDWLDDYWTQTWSRSQQEIQLLFENTNGD